MIAANGFEILGKGSGKVEMANSVLIDTDILIDAARNNENAINRLSREEQGAILRISAITQMELIVGCRNKKELSNLEKFLFRFEILPVEENISKIFDPPNFSGAPHSSSFKWAPFAETIAWYERNRWPVPNTLAAVPL